MAGESVANVRDSAFFLPYDEVNRAGKLLAQARGIAAAVGVAVQHDNELPEQSLSDACWAVQDLLNEVEAITALKSEPLPEPQS